MVKRRGTPLIEYEGASAINRVYVGLGVGQMYIDDIYDYDGYDALRDKVEIALNDVYHGWEKAAEKIAPAHRIGHCLRIPCRFLLC